MRDEYDFSDSVKNLYPKQEKYTHIRENTKDNNIKNIFVKEELEFKFEKDILGKLNE